MPELNYHRLRYFWVVATEGSMVAAARRLSVSQPTVSAQIQGLEEDLDRDLFLRRGRTLELTKAGQVVLRHADEIFGLGESLIESLTSGSDRAPLQLAVGTADPVPKIVVRSILEPALSMDRPVSLLCREWRTDHLLAELAVHRLDLVLTDAPVSPSIRARTLSLKVGESGVGLFGTPALVARFRHRFPRSLRDAPLVLPTRNTALRETLDSWFDANGVRPCVLIETEDRALLNHFGQSGAGLIPVAAVTQDEIRRQFGVERVGWLKGVREHYYAVTVQRSPMHPAVGVICEAARERFRARPAPPVPSPRKNAVERRA